jgi:hypothetical protein
MLLILFGAFVGNLNKVVDYWFNSEDRDKMLIQKVDEEDGSSLSSAIEYPTTPRPPQGPVVIIRKEETVAEPTYTEAPVPYEEPLPYEESLPYEEPLPLEEDLADGQSGAGTDEGHYTEEKES